MIDSRLIERKFAELGARCDCREWREDERSRPPYVLDLPADRRGRTFRLRYDDAQVDGVEILDHRPRRRHLVLLVRARITDRRSGEESFLMHRFLCGHDERAWFAAGLPESARITTVRQAVEALKPFPVRAAQWRARVRSRHRDRRKTRAFVRQGEWFFLPAPRLKVPESEILRPGSMWREGGTPHIADEMYRTGGTIYRVRGRIVEITDEVSWMHRLITGRGRLPWIWREQGKPAAMYVRGRVRHRDHATVVLHSWHRVLASTEGAGLRTVRDAAVSHLRSAD